MARKSNADKAKEALQAIAQSDFFGYCFLTQNEGIDFSKEQPRYVPTRFHKWLCKTVWEFCEKKTANPYDVLCLSVPPQHGKSITITETLPSFYLGHYPERRVIEASYGEGFAKKFGKANKRKVEKYGGIFGITIAKDTKSVTDWKLSNGIGGMISRGLLSGITGEAGDLIIIDDPIKNSSEASSTTIRDKIFDEWQSTVLSRVQRGSKVIVIQTRWHEDDLIGRIMATNKFATYYNLEALCESENDPLGRKEGEALCPEMGKDEEWLGAYKENLTSGAVDVEGESGLRAWTALFQGHPTNRQGNILRKEWWQLYDGDIADYDMQIMSVDPAFKDNGDYVAIEIWCKKGPNIYLVDLVKEHLNFQATMTMILQRSALYPCDFILVEDKANGTAIIETLRRQIQGVIGYVPKGSKEERVNAVSFAIESGNVFLPRKKKFTAPFIEECSQFPHGKHDDTVDAMSQALHKLIWHNRRIERPKEFNILDEFTSPMKKKRGYGKGDKRYVI